MQLKGISRLYHRFINTIDIKIVIILLLFSVPIAYMQYSKHKWQISQLDTFYDYFICLHSEMVAYWCLSALAIFLKWVRRIFFPVLSVFFLVSVADFCSWFTIEEPFHPVSIVRLIDLIMFYPEFIYEVGNIFLLKLIIFLACPAFFFAITRLLVPLMENSKYATYLNSLYVTLLVFIVLGTGPAVASKDYVYKNTFAKIVEETVYDYEIRHNTDSRQYIIEQFGVTDHGKDKAVFNERDHVAHPLNVVIYILETAPFRYYPDVMDCCLATGNQWLYANGVPLNRHYSTFPETDRAIYSIFTGKYPPLVKGSKWKKEFNYEDALPIVLRKLGFTSHFLSTAPLDFHNDGDMVRGIGFDNIKEVSEVRDALKIDKGKRIWERRKLYRADEILIEKAIDILDSYCTSDNRPFFLSIATQSSHAPFQIPPGSEVNQMDEAQRIKQNAVWQFMQIKKIVDKIAEIGCIERTLFIIAGDHGVRSKYESKTLFEKPYLLNSLTFHVPALIALSGFNEKLRLLKERDTSHIDFVPTIVDLMGDRAQSEKYHGVSFFRDARRTIYFIGDGYLPVSGFKKENYFFMENRNKRLYLTSRSFDFEKPASEKANGHRKENSGVVFHETVFHQRSMIAEELMKLRAFLWSSAQSDSRGKKR